jgi:hypothetical protein
MRLGKYLKQLAPVIRPVTHSSESNRTLSMQLKKFLSGVSSGMVQLYKLTMSRPLKLSGLMFMSVKLQLRNLKVCNFLPTNMLGVNKLVFILKFGKEISFT